MSIANYAAPRLYVDIYPKGGGMYSISGNEGMILRCKVSKNIKSKTPGTFSLLLAPGGPTGVNNGHSWAEVIPPLSLVVIGMTRYKHRNIVMIGVVTSPTSNESWEIGESVTRVTTITGLDFQYFFNTFSYYTLSMLGSTVGAGLSSSQNSDVGLPEALGAGLLGGSSPATVGEDWYNMVMAGTKGILSNTQIAYQKGNVKFPDVMATVFEEYQSSVASGVSIPFSQYYLTSSGNWYDKFSLIFQFPFYEMFIITAPDNYSPYSSTGALTPASTTITMDPKDGSGFMSASPTLVARMNPVPYCSEYSGEKFTMDKSTWENNLINYTLENTGFIESTSSFTVSYVRNLYLLIPTLYSTLNGVSNNALSSFIYTFDCFINTDSINSYGYRPEIVKTEYFSDVKGMYAKNNAANKTNTQKLFENLTLRIATYYEPTDKMVYGSVSMELRPDIIPGNKFTYTPFKNGQPYEFYIEGFEHEYEFGGESKTTLTLSRGLPKSVYDNIPLLTGIHSGNAVRVNGEYDLQTSPGALTFLNFGGNSIKSALTRLCQDFITPQGATT